MIHIHDDTKLHLKALASHMPHALLVTGPSGVGLTGIVNEMARELGTPVITVLPEKDEKIDTEKGVISVDSIRRLYDMTKTKATGPRLIAIDYAERMGSQAQNAFLKLLEEPPVHTHFVLMTHDPSTLLPTVRSRAQSLDVRPVTIAQSEQLLDELGVKDQTKRRQLLFVAEGLPAELTRLASDDAAFERRAGIIRDARTYVQGSSYDTLVIGQKYKDNREQALLLVSDAMRMLRESVAKDADGRILKRLEAVLNTYERLQQNGNIRLQLAASMV